MRSDNDLNQSGDDYVETSSSDLRNQSGRGSVESNSNDLSQSGDDYVETSSSDLRNQSGRGSVESSTSDFERVEIRNAFDGV